MRLYIFKDINGNHLEYYSPLHLPIKENIIIKKSIELFDDDEPCIIHRTYVMKKLMLELDSIVENLIDKNSNLLKIDNGIIWDYIDTSPNTAYIDIYY